MEIAPRALKGGPMVIAIVLWCIGSFFFGMAFGKFLDKKEPVNYQPLKKV